MTALEFLNANVDNKLTVFWVSIGNPTGTEIAYQPEYYEVPIREFDDLEGDVSDGEWKWGGEGSPRDYNGNSVTRIEIQSNPKEWDKQIAQYEMEYPY